MELRSSCKALIIKDDKILLNRCHDSYGDYFCLPGGGQHLYEPLYETVIRECLEETGYSVIPVRFAALCEIVRKNRLHKIYHIFLCEIQNEKRLSPTHMDKTQVCSQWVDINSINSNTRFVPSVVGENIQGILNNTAPVFLGTR